MYDPKKELKTQVKVPNKVPNFFTTERLKIIDFGLARDLSRVKSDSIPISICGTVEFISPEVMNCTQVSICPHNRKDIINNG